MPTHQCAGHTRRDVLAGSGAIAAAVMFAGDVHAIRSRRVRGRVLIWDEHLPRHGSGLAGVMVSDGQNVTLTDSHGSWELDAAPDRSVFVIKPSGWTYLETSGVPRLTPVQSIDGTFDFHLRPQAEDKAFEVALLADTQAANAVELDYVRREIARSALAGSHAFVINHGDVMGDHLHLLKPYKAIVRDTGMIWHHCPGNHDMDLASSTHARAFDTWKQEIGPTHYAFQYAQATFIVLNNVEYFGAGAASVEGRLYRGRIGEQQLMFVRNILQHVPKDHLVVVSMHIPLVSFENPNAPGDNTADRAQLMSLLSGFPHTVSFSGHSHTTEHHYLGPEQGFLRSSAHHHHVLTAFSGSWWGGPLNEHGIPTSDSRDGSPRGYHVLCIQGSSYKTRFVALGDTTGSTARLSSGSQPADQTQTARQSLTVDVFDGGPKTRVRGRVRGTGTTFELQRTTMPDPHIVDSYARHRDLLKPWVSPAPSSHMWTGSLPVEATGDVMLEITDEYGSPLSIVMQA